MTGEGSSNFIGDLKNYNTTCLRSDLIAGLTVAIMLIPQGIAYGVLAGLPAIYGLYAAFIPLIIYPLFGSSKQLSVGPVALVSIMVLSGLSAFALPGSTEFIQLAILTAFVAGAIQLILAVFRMGFLVNYLSEPVLAGFTAAAALIIACSQLKNLLGFDLDRTTNILSLIKNLATHISQTHLPTLLLGASALAIILILKSIKKTFPSALLVVVLGTAIVYFASLHEKGVDILGLVPRGLPKFNVSFFDPHLILQVTPLALAICLISFIESLAIAKTISARHDNYPIDANRELLGLGLGKMLGAFFQAFPSTGSFTRSAINDQSGAKSGVASLFAALFIGIVLLFLTSLLFYLPTTILAAIIIAAVLGLINIPYARRLFSLDRNDFYVYFATFILTLLLGIQQGVFAGIILSVIMILYKSSKPHYAILGKLPGSDSFRNINRYRDTIITESTLIIRYDDDLYFGNANHFYDTVSKELALRPAVQNLILNCATMSQIDSTGLHYFQLLLDYLNRKKIRLVLTNLRGPVRDLLRAANLETKIGAENYYLSIKDAVDGLEFDSEQLRLKQKYALQTNRDQPQ